MAYATTTITMASYFCNEWREEGGGGEKLGFLWDIVYYVYNVHNIGLCIPSAFILSMFILFSWVLIRNGCELCVYHLTFLSPLFFLASSLGWAFGWLIKVSIFFMIHTNLSARAHTHASYEIVVWHFSYSLSLLFAIVYVCVNPFENCELVSLSLLRHFHQIDSKRLRHWILGIFQAQL